MEPLEENVRKLEKLQESFSAYLLKGGDPAKIWLQKNEAGDFVVQERPGFAQPPLKWLKGPNFDKELKEIQKIFKAVVGYEGKKKPMLSLLTQNVNALTEHYAGSRRKAEIDALLIPRPPETHTFADTVAGYRFLLTKLLELAALAYPKEWSKLPYKETLLHALVEGSLDAFFATLEEQDDTVCHFLSGFRLENFATLNPTALDAILKKAPDNEYALALLGWIQKDAATLERVLDSNPRNGFALGWRAALTLSTLDPTAPLEKVRNCLEDLLQAKVYYTDPVIDAYIGIASMIIGEVDVSISENHLKVALAICPDFPLAEKWLNECQQYSSFVDIVDAFEKAESDIDFHSLTSVLQNDLHPRLKERVVKYCLQGILSARKTVPQDLVLPPRQEVKVVLNAWNRADMVLYNMAYDAPGAAFEHKRALGPWRDNIIFSFTFSEYLEAQRKLPARYVAPEEETVEPLDQRHIEQEQPSDDRYRKIVGAFFLAMTGVSLALWLYHTGPQQVRDLRADVEKFQREVKAFVPPEKMKVVDIEAVLIGNLLHKDKYEALHRPNAFKALTMRAPSVRPILQKVLLHFGDKAPDKESISKIVDRYTSYRLAQESTMPLLHFPDFNTWWKLFTSEQKEKPKVMGIPLPEHTKRDVRVDTVYQTTHHQATTQVQQVRALQEVVEKGFSKPLSSIEFAHVAGDLFSRNTGLEGSDAFTAWQVMLPFLRHLVTGIEKIDPSKGVQYQPVLSKWALELEQAQAFYQQKAISESITALEMAEKTGVAPEFYQEYKELFSRFAKDNRIWALEEGLAAINEKVLKDLQAHYTEYLERWRKDLSGTLRYISDPMLRPIFQSASEHVLRLASSEDLLKAFFDKLNLVSKNEPFYSVINFLDAAVKYTIKKWAPVLKTTLEKLEVGQTLLLRGGWMGRGERPGHEMSYGITRNPDKDFSFTFVNTGAGLELHGDKIEKEMPRVLELGVDSMDPFLSEEFLTVVVSLAHTQGPRLDGISQWSAEDAYTIFDTLQRPLRGVLMREKGKWQYSGICAFAALIARFQSDIKDPVFRRHLNIIMQIAALSSFLQNETIEPSSRVFARDVLEYVRQSTTELGPDGENVLTDAELLFFRDRIAFFQERLSERRELAPTIPIGTAKVEGPAIRSQVRMGIPLPQRVQAAEKAHPVRSFQYVKGFDVASITLVQQEIQKALELGDYSHAIYCAQAAVENMEIAQMKSRYSQMREEEKIGIVRDLSSLLHSILLAQQQYVNANPSAQKTISHDLVVTSLFILTLLDAFHSLDGGTESLISKNSIFPDYLQDAFLTPSPSLVPRLIEMQEHIQHAGENFFGFRKITFSPRQGSFRFSYDDISESAFLTEVAHYHRKHPEVVSSLKTSYEEWRQKNTQVPIPLWDTLTPNTQAYIATQHSIEMYQVIGSSVISSTLLHLKPEELLPPKRVEERNALVACASLLLFAQIQLPHDETPHFEFSSETNVRESVYLDWHGTLRGTHLPYNIDYPIKKGNLRHIESAVPRVGKDPLEKRLTTKERQQPHRESGPQIALEEKPIAVGVTVQELQALLYLASNPSSQVVHTIHYFRQHFEMLSNKDLRVHFSRLLFQEGLLYQALKNESGPLLIGAFKELIENACSVSTSFQSTLTTLELLQIAEQFNEIAGQPHVDVAGALTAIHPETSEQVALKASLELRSLEQRGITSDEEAIQAILASIRYSGAHLVHDGITSHEKLKELQILQKLGPPLLERLEKAKGALLNPVVKELGLLEIDLEWTQIPATTTFQATVKDQKVYYSLETGELTFSGAKVTRLPHEVISRADFQEFFPARERHIDALQLAPNIWTVKIDKKSYTLILDEDQLVMQTEDGKERFITSETVKGIPLSIRKGGHKAGQIWSYKTPIGTAAFVVRPLYSIVPEVSSWDTDFTRYKVYLLDSQGRKTHELLDPKAEDLPYSFLAKVENPEMLRVWKKVDQDNIDRIEMPSFGDAGQFRSMQGRLESMAYPGWYISDNQYVAEIGAFPHALVLENAKGDREVLIPSWSFQRKVNALDITTKFDYTEKASLYRYKVDMLHGGILTAENREARAHLAYIHLWQHNYEKALALLQEDRFSYTEEMVATERTIYNQLVSASEKTGDQSPPALEVSLRANWALLMNDWHTSNVTPDFSTLLTLYEGYLEYRHAITFHPFNADEELALLELMPKTVHSPLITRRLEELSSVTPSKEAPPICLPFPAFVTDPAGESLLTDEDLAKLIIQKESTTTATTLLKQLDPARAKDDLAKSELTRAREGLSRYQKEVHFREYRLRRGAEKELRSLQEKTHATLESAKAKQKELRSAIERLANKSVGGLPEAVAKVKLELARATHTWTPHTADVCIDLVLQGDDQSFHTLNPLLTPLEREELYQKCVLYLAQESGEVYRQEAFLAATEKLLKSASREELEVRAKEFVEAAQMKRAYNIAENPQLLVYEVRFHQEQDARLVLVYPHQVEFLKSMSHHLQDREGLGIVYELFMGGGKTSVGFINLLAEAALGHTAFMIVPQNLKAMFHDIARFLKVRGFQVQRFPSPSRDIDSLVSLKRLLGMLDRAGVLLATKEEIEAKQLQLQRHIDELSWTPTAEQKEWLSLAFQVNDKLHKAIYAVDEMPVVYNPNTEFLLPNQAARHLPTKTIELIAEFSRMLLTSAKELDIAIGGVHTASEPYSEELYHTRYKEKIVEAFLEKADMASLEPYLLTQDGKAAKEYEATIQDPALRSTVNFLKMMIDSVLPDALALNLNIDYGLPKPEEVERLSSDIRSRVKPFVAIPAAGSNAMQYGAEFANPGKTTWTTIVAHWVEGLSQVSIEKKMKKLADAAKLEIKRVPLLKTAAYEAFVEFLPPGATPETFNLFELRPEQLEEITRSLNSRRTSDPFWQIMKEELEIGIEVYPSFYTAVPMGLTTGGTVLGGTGTNFNPDSLPSDIFSVSDPQSMGIMQKLEEIKPEVRLFSLREMKEQESVEARVRTLYSHLPPTVGTLIDETGAFAGINEEELPQALLKVLEERGQKRDGIVTFLTNKQPALVTESGKEPYSHAKVMGKNVAAIYTQTKTTGSDARLPEKEQAVCLIGKTSIAAYVFQAVARLRQLGAAKQTVCFALDEEALPQMKKQLERVGLLLSDPPTFEETLLFLILNQADVVGENNVKALQHKLTHKLIDVWTGITGDRSLSVTAKAEISTLFREQFYTMVMEGEYLFFGYPEKIPKEEWCKRVLAAFDQMHERISKGLGTIAQQAMQNAYKDAHALVETMKEKLPDLIGTTQAGVSGQVSVETQQKQEQETKVTLQLEMRVGEPPTRAPQKIVDWTKGALTSASYYRDKAPFISMNTAVSKLPEGKELGKLLPDELLTTTNVLPSGAGIKLFEPGQLDIQYIFVVMEQNQPVKYVLLSQTDYDLLLPHEPLPFPIVALDGRPVRGGAFPDTPQFRKILVLAKLLNGETDYTRDELATLETLIQETGPKLQKLFELQLREPRRDLSRERYPTSELLRCWGKGL